MGHTITVLSRSRSRNSTGGRINSSRTVRSHILIDKPDFLEYRFYVCGQLERLAYSSACLAYSSA